MDFIGPLPRTKNFHDTILLVIDKLTKQIHLAATTQKVTAQQTAKLVMREVVRLHGVPSSIISDRDPRFTSAFWQALWRQLNTQLRMSTDTIRRQTVRHSANRVVEDMLPAFVNLHRDDWDEHLHTVELAYNSTPHASTGFSPFELNGSSAMLPIDIASHSEAPPDSGSRRTCRQQTIW
jgi:hypothetical protein